MRNYNTNNKNYDDVEIAGIVFIVGVFGFVIFIPWVIFDFFMNGLDINSIINKFGAGLFICLCCVTPSLSISIVNYSEKYYEKRQQKAFDKLLKDQILLSILNDNELNKNWKLFEKTMLLRTKELIDDPSLYNYKNFLYDLRKYRDNIVHKKAIASAEEQRLLQKNLQEKVDDELAQKILNDKKDKIINNN